MVPPLAPRYPHQIPYIHGLIARGAAAVDRRDTLLVVTGDHGMAARGTHGGEEEARLTPYVMVGPGIRAGVELDVAQTALTSTFTTLLGLPFLPVSESPPLTAILDRPADASRALVTEYYTAKLAAARRLGAVDGSPETIDDTKNRELNALLFGADSSRLGLRVLALATTALGVLIAAWLAWRSAPAAFPRPAMPHHLGLALMAPLSIGVAATGFIVMRGALAFRSSTIALVLMAALLGVLVVAGLALLRSPDLLAHVKRRQLSLFLPVFVVLAAPLVNSHWLHPRPYFELLAVAGATLVARLLGGGRAAAIALVVSVATLYAPQWTQGAWQNDVLLPLVSLAVVVLAAREIRRQPGALALVGCVTLVACFATAWWWRGAPSTTTATLVVGLFSTAIATAIFLRADVGSAAALVIGAATAMFLIMASEVHEAVVFAATALVALAVARLRLDLERPAAVYATAALAVLVRVCLYFALGDQYNISSIRTAPGFVLVEAGTPLLSVVPLLLLKYTLPWLLILAALLPSLARTSAGAASHFVDCLVLGYVARFAAVAAVVDPLRALPNGMDGIVGMYAVTWAEFLTFGIAAVVAGTILHDTAVVPSPTRAPDLARRLSATPRLST
jgi:hypothetical protein